MSLQDLTNKDLRRVDEAKKDQSQSICEDCLGHNELVCILEKALLEVVEENSVISNKENELFMYYQDCIQIENELIEQIQCLNKVNTIKL